MKYYRDPTLLIPKSRAMVQRFLSLPVPVSNAWIRCACPSSVLSAVSAIHSGDDERQSHHFTGCPSFSNITLTVAHENLTRPGNPNVLSRDAPSHALVLGSIAFLRQSNTPGVNGRSRPPPGYPDPTLESQTAASDNDSASSHAHSSRQASRVTFAAILAALTILYFASAFASTVNLIPGNRFDRNASWPLVGPSAST